MTDEDYIEHLESLLITIKVDLEAVIKILDNTTIVVPPQQLVFSVDVAVYRHIKPIIKQIETSLSGWHILGGTAPDSSLDK